MKKGFLKIALLLATAFMVLSFDLPNGWFCAGSKPKSYEMGLAKGAGQDGKNAATIKSIDKEISGFGTLMQESIPGKYLGKRIKMSGYVKTENVINWSALWFRVDKEGSNDPLAFDNMHDRQIKGTTDWKKYEMVLDVPANASLIAYGALLHGTGQLWFDNITIEIVDNSTPTTGSIKAKSSTTQNEPANLDFEK